MEIKDLYKLFLEHPVVSTDSRRITPGCMYFALKGEKFDGNRFAADSIKAGAAYAVADDPSLTGHERIILVDDVLETLQALATHHRRKLGVPQQPHWSTVDPAFSDRRYRDGCGGDGSQPSGRDQHVM
jgi:UDP-N-acetylmuramoyl-tripeptide--D-alanyl-D-alanine ligase